MLKSCSTLLIILLVTACNLFAQPEKGVEQGMIRVKIKPELEAALQTKQLSVPTGTLSLGIKTLDQLNQTYSATEMKRVFPFAGKYEAKHRKHGLHLWYDIVISKEIDPSNAAKSYDSYDDIEMAYAIPTIVQYHMDLDETQKLTDKAVNQIKQQATSNDPVLEDQWHYNNTGQVAGSVPGVDIRLFNAWEKTMGSKNVIVSVVDGGVDFSHPDLAANMWVNQAEKNGTDGQDDDGNTYTDDIYGYNFVSQNGTIVPERHGTHVAGTIAAVNNNNTGVAGIAGGATPGEGVRIMSCQIFEDGKTAPGNASRLAIMYGADNGAVISQNSWGYRYQGQYDPAVLTAIRYFIAEAGTDEHGDPLPNTPMVGGIVIFAAGNDNSNELWYPQAWDEVMAVGAVTMTGARAPYSNYADWVDISAPGGSITSYTDPRGVISTFVHGSQDGSYGSLQGTSMACPHVSGVAALVLSYYGNAAYTPDMLRDRLLFSATPLNEWEPNYANQLGAGLVNAEQALKPFTAVDGVIVQDEAAVLVGETLAIPAIVTPDDAFNKGVSWLSRTPAVATVNRYGVVTGVSEGEAMIVATTVDGGFKDSCKVTVSPVYVSGIQLTPTSTRLNKQATTTLTPTIIPANATNKNVTWTSSNTNVATVSANGLVSAIEIGTTTITVKTNEGNFTATCQVTVSEPVTGISVYPTTVRLMVGQETDIIATITPDDATNKNVIWISSNPASVSVTNGHVTALQVFGTRNEDKITITARSEDGNHQATTDVHVYFDEQIPEGFSPNGDNVNDYFAMTLKTDEIYSIRIFDRSGQMYYESDDYMRDTNNMGWDGIANKGFKKGEKVHQGSYYYVLTGKKGGSVKKGFVVVKY